MWWKTHASAGAVAGLYYLSHMAGTSVFPKTSLSTAAFVGISIAASIAVDIDSKDSKIGRLIYPVSVTTEATIGHRGPLHSPFVAAFIYAALMWLVPLSVNILGPVIALPILIGYIGGHLIPDLFNPEGLPLWPLKGRISIPLITPLGALDKGLCVMLDIWICIFLAHAWFGLKIPEQITVFF